MDIRRKRAVPPTAAGFSLIELLVVVAIIVIAASVAVPAIVNYMRNYRMRSALQEISTDINRARNTAIMTNTNTGVAFVIADNNSYRWVSEDALPPGPVPVPDPRYGPLHDLPQNLQFQGGNAGAFRFQRLGTWCAPPPAGTCGAAVVIPACQAAEASRCAGAPGPYITTDAAGSRITIRDTQSGDQRVLRVMPGGRVVLP
jgi:prepilin-type N-terminal cleavage/methylation domain-containing protein